MENTIKKLKKLLDDQCKSNQALKSKLRQAEKKIKDLEYVISNFNQLKGDSVSCEKRDEKDHL